jgi:hypothetical protein
MDEEACGAKHLEEYLNENYSINMFGKLYN